MNSEMHVTQIHVRWPISQKHLRFRHTKSVISQYDQTWLTRRAFSEIDSLIPGLGVTWFPRRDDTLVFFDWRFHQTFHDSCCGDAIGDSAHYFSIFLVPLAFKLNCEAFSCPRSPPQ